MDQGRGTNKPRANSLGTSGSAPRVYCRALGPVGQAPRDQWIEGPGLWDQWTKGQGHWDQWTKGPGLSDQWTKDPGP